MRKKILQLKYVALLASAAYALTFLIYYLFAYAVESRVWLIYLANFARDFSLSIIPILLGVLIINRGYGYKNILKHGALFALFELFYTVPFYYVYFVSLGYGLGEALVLILIQTLISLFLSFARLVILCAIFLYVYQRVIKKYKEQTVKVDTGSIFDLQNPTNAAIFASCGFVFLISLVREIFETVSFLIEAFGTYRTDEIIYIVVRYLFLFITLIVSYATAQKLHIKIKLYKGEN